MEGYLVSLYKWIVPQKFGKMQLKLSEILCRCPVSISAVTIHALHLFLEYRFVSLLNDILIVE